jgi:hydroxyacylglutathione hydrolase
VTVLASYLFGLPGCLVEEEAGGGGPSAGGLDCAEATLTDFAEVSVDDLYNEIQEGDALTVLDVREVVETSSGIVEGALIYPWSSGVLEAEHADLPQDTRLFVICRTGSRSPSAAGFLVENGYECVHDVLGGIVAWKDAGYPTVEPP